MKKNKKSKLSSKYVFIVFVIVIALILVYFAIGLYIANQMSLPKPGMPQVSRSSISSDSEDISFQASDGIILKGWFFHATSDKLVILVPGANLDRVNFSYGTPSIMRFLISSGYNILAFDPRGIGQSQQVHISFASKDYRDVLGAIAYAGSRGFSPKKIAILGDSLGAITTVFGSPYFQNVGVLIADSPASVLEPVITKQLINEKHVPSFLVPGVYLMAHVVFGINIASVRPIDAIKKVPNRIFLFLHGANDTLIPIQNSYELLANANPKSKLIVFPGGGHVGTFTTNAKLYETVIKTFLQNQLGD